MSLQPPDPAASVLTMGDMWHLDRDERTVVGALIHAAKDHDDLAAAHVLADRFGRWVARNVRAPGAVVVGIPPDPARPWSLATRLAESAADWLATELQPGLVTRGASTARARDTELALRPSLIAAADYRVQVDPGRPVVLVDDVVLSGTTLGHVAGLVAEAGAPRVVTVAAARSRQRD